MQRQKSVLRDHFIQKTKNFTRKHSNKNLSQKVIDLLKPLNWSSFKKVGLYSALSDEVCLAPLFHKYPHISWLYPRKTEEGSFKFFKAQREDELRRYSNDILKNVEAVSLEEVDLFLVPGVSFDRGMRRLGRGLGFYDLVLTQAPRAIKVGVCWSVQVSDEFLPSEDHDQQMDLLVTENWLLCSQKFLNQTKKVS